MPKIIHYVVNNTPNDEKDLRQRLTDYNLGDLDREIINNSLTSDAFYHNVVHWLKEFYQKESIKKALVGLADDDMCFISDVDEIWNPDARFDLTSDRIFKFRQRVYLYYLNNNSSEPWVGTMATKYKNIKNSCLNHLRNPTKTRYKFINNGGWHFTSMGGLEKVREKLNSSYTSESYNTPEIQAKLEERMRENKDYIGRNFKFWTDESNLPSYLIDHKEEYKKLFK